MSTAEMSQYNVSIKCYIPQGQDIQSVLVSYHFSQKLHHWILWCPYLCLCMSIWINSKPA